MHERLPTERIATATWLFVRGEQMTVLDLAAKLNMTERGTRVMLEKLSLAIPLIVETEVGGRAGVWRLLDD